MEGSAAKSIYKAKLPRVGLDGSQKKTSRSPNNSQSPKRSQSRSRSPKSSYKGKTKAEIIDIRRKN